jgi:hypothetical protein
MGVEIELREPWDNPETNLETHPETTPKRFRVVL